MRIITYEFSIKGSDGWIFDQIELGTVNLVVGDTASGKTRFLNTIFNLGSSVTGSRKIGAPSQWKLTFSHKGKFYSWQINTEISSDNRPIITRERLLQHFDSTTTTLVDRTSAKFLFQGSKIPKLQSDTPSILSLKEEDSIRPIHEGFSLILRREFFADALKDLMPVSVPQAQLLQKPVENLLELHMLGLPTNLKLYYLSKTFPDIFRSICNNFTSVFPFVKYIELKDLKDLYPNVMMPGPTPIFSVKERHIKKWIGIHELSSGMQKVLLILTDTFTLPEGSIYLIDEYENSLGVSAIDFFPPFLTSHERDVQFIITSHHPYLINNIPAENWLVFHRKGSRVKARYGALNIDIYGKSKQERFNQLLNDPFYSEGIE